MSKHKEKEIEQVDDYAAAVPRKTWIVSPKGSNATREVHADTIEDAVRTFNGSQTSFTIKQLDIVEG